MRTLAIGALVCGAFVFAAQGQTDWPNFSHDAGGTRYSPLKSISDKNVANLKLAWTYDETAPVTETPRGPRPPRPDAAANAAPGTNAAPGLMAPGARAAGDARPQSPRIRQSKSVPLVIGDTMYFSTPYNRLVALNAETGAKIWEYEIPFSPSSRGISYWPGDAQHAPQIFVGTNRFSGRQP